MPNVTVENALDAVAAAVRDGASPKAVDNGLLERLKDQLRPAFTKRMSRPGVWKAERLKLLQMAAYIGTVARFFMDTENAASITKKHLFNAAAFVQRFCPVGANVNGTKKWCQGAKF